MSARTATRGRHRRGAANEGHGDDERWLLTYADMITLLMALFMVLFSISSVNTSKYETLQRVLQDAFSGKVLPGGKSVQQAGTSEEARRAAPQPPVPAIQPFAKPEETKREEAASKAAQREQDDFEELKRKLDAYAKANGLENQIRTRIAQRGLVISVLTDKVLFDSGSARLKPAASPLLGHVAELLALDTRHPVVVEGHTDNLPIEDERYPSNWELSGARASSVVRFLLGHDVRPTRLEAAGFAHLRPVRSNATAAGRSRNRRVEIVLLRTAKEGSGGPVNLP